MARARVRSRAAVNRSRRTPTKAGGGRPSIPWFPVAVVAGAIAVIGLLVFVIMQSGGSDDDRAAAIAAEQDASTSLAGDFIDLEKVYGGEYSETAGHVTTSNIDYEGTCSASDPELCNTNPPVGGPHWSANCGDDPTTAPAVCGPAPWGIYRDPWQPETLVHNMEHGGVVIWYNTTDQDVIDQLESFVEGRPDDDLLVLTPYPDMEDDTVAITSWTRIDKFPAAEYDEERLTTFIDDHMRRFNPEHF
jgi:hypothetical protein